jgi:hypothetical protein
MESKSPPKPMETENTDFIQTLRSGITNITSMLGNTLNLKMETTSSSSMNIRNKREPSTKGKRSTSIFARRQIHGIKNGVHL